MNIVYVYNVRIIFERKENLFPSSISFLKIRTYRLEFIFGIRCNLKPIVKILKGIRRIKRSARKNNEQRYFKLDGTKRVDRLLNNLIAQQFTELFLTELNESSRKLS